ncbi:MAG: hypothetical protein HDQ89_04895 [Desulfovibrio sp.]|nr:hypothetical protein [Desulfovibrio sp.]
MKHPRKKPKISRVAPGKTFRRNAARCVDKTMLFRDCQRHAANNLIFYIFSRSFPTKRVGFQIVKNQAFIRHDRGGEAIFGQNPRQGGKTGGFPGYSSAMQLWTFLNHVWSEAEDGCWCRKNPKK